MRKVTHRLTAILGALALFILLSIPSTAQIPCKMSYQGILRNSTGNPVYDGAQNVDFNIYDVATSTLLYSQTISITTANGLFSTTIGPLDNFAVSLCALNWGQEMELELVLTSGPLPRTKLTTSPHAFHAAVADNFASGFSGWQANPIGGLNFWHLAVPNQNDPVMAGSMTPAYQASLNAVALPQLGASISWHTAGVAGPVGTPGYGVRGVVMDNPIGPATAYRFDVSHTPVAPYEARGYDGDIVFADGGNATGFKMLNVHSGPLTAGTTAFGLSIQDVHADVGAAYGVHLPSVHSDNGTTAYGVRATNTSVAGIQYGVWGEIASPTAGFTSAGVYARGQGTGGPGVLRAAALEINNGAVRTSGANQPSGVVVIAGGPLPAGPAVLGPFAVANPLVIAGSRIVCTVRMTGILAGAAVQPWFPMITNIGAGTFSVMVGSPFGLPTPVPPVGSTLVLHYWIVNP